MSLKGFLLTWGFASKERTEERAQSGQRAQAVEQDYSYEFLSDHRIINGTPGTLSDSQVLTAIYKVEHGNYTSDGKYGLLDNLTFAVHNNHERGMAAGVLDEISDAIARVQRR